MKFVKHFSIISKPLTNLLKKVVLLIWTSEHDKIFSTLKAALVQALVLSLPNFSKPFVVEAYTCGSGIEVVLMQEGHPLAYLSEAL
jgi:hypothetical protein